METFISINVPYVVGAKYMGLKGLNYKNGEFVDKVHKGDIEPYQMRPGLFYRITSTILGKLNFMWDENEVGRMKPLERHGKILPHTQTTLEGPFGEQAQHYANVRKTGHNYTAGGMGYGD